MQDNLGSVYIRTHPAPTVSCEHDKALTNNFSLRISLSCRPLPLHFYPNLYSLSYKPKMGAEAIAYSLAAQVLNQLGTFVFHEIWFLCCSWDEKTKLQSTVAIILEKLVDAEEQQAEKPTVKEWIKRLKDVLYDADDLLDDFATEKLRRKVDNPTRITGQVRDFFSSSNQVAFRVRKGYKIKKIREKLDEIANDMNQFNFVSSTSQRLAERHALIKGRGDTYSWVHEEEVIGRENEKEHIIGLLLNAYSDRNNVPIISIVGIGGLGKTTLAKYVYGDERLQKYFDIKLWACVSEPFDVNQIVGRILESATGKKPENLSLEGMQKNLQKEIKDKKYLLVLDDVWNENPRTWDELGTLLMGGAKGSKILVTTRSEKVARIIGSSFCYPLKGLSDDKSWSLFKTRAFVQGQEPANPKIVAIGREIVSKCRGVPLAIKTLGSLLFLRDPETEWSSLKDIQLSKITQNDNDIMAILKLSYDHLPSNLKQCFAYCSLFPKDYKLDKQRLIKLWMAQGFIELSDKNQQPEDVADGYFRELLWRSFFQDVEKDWWGDITYCKMHDLMHELATLVAGSESHLADSDAKDIGEKVRHVSFNSSFLASWDSPTPFLRVKKIRTFLLPAQQWYHDLKVIKTYFDTLVPTFKSLRALDLHNLGVKEIPISLGKLKHLRYLDLSENKDIEELPNSISQLQNLETLLLTYCSKLIKLPKDIGKLVNLRHLDINGCSNLYHLPCGLGELTSLRTLSWFCQNDPTLAGVAGLNELGALNNLRGYFRLYFMDGVQYSNSSELAVIANLKAKEHIRTLSYFWWIYEEDNHMSPEDTEAFFEVLQPHPNIKELEVHYYWGVRFPHWTMGDTLHNLVAITIKRCHNCQKLPPMHQLPYLRYLKLERLPAVECIIDEPLLSSELFFPSLQELLLWYLPMLKGFRRKIYEDDDDEALTNRESTFELTKLNLCDCPMLKSFPMHPNLQSLRIFEVGADQVHQQLTSVDAARGPHFSSSSPSSSSSSSCSLSKLIHLHLEQIWDLESFPSDVVQNLTSLRSLEILQCNQLLRLAASEEEFRGLYSLRYLKIKDCNGLRSLSRGIQHLTMLEELQIICCQELNLTDDDDNGMHWQGLRSLRKLYLEEIPKFVSLPGGIQHLTTLQHLEIHSCQEYMVVPEWIANFTSLQRLVIKGCSNLRSLPKEISCLRSLQELLIANCPVLTERCQKQTGEDWHKIAHIPSIIIDDETIQASFIN